MNARTCKLTSLSAATGALVLAASPLGAQTYTWDADPGTGGNQDGPGIWEAGQPNWDTGGAPNRNWVDGSDAVIGAAVGEGGTISIAGTVNANTMTLNDPGSGDYTLGGNGALTVNGGTTKNGSATVTLGGNATFNLGGVSVVGGRLVIATDVMVFDGRIPVASFGTEIEITGNGSLTAGGAQAFLFGDITLRDNATLGLFGHGNWELDDGTGAPQSTTLTILDNATFTADRDGAAHGYVGTGGIGTQGIGGFTYGLEWNQYSSSTIDQRGGTVNLTNPIDGVNPWGPGLVLAHNATGGSEFVDNRYNLSGGVLNVSSVACLGPMPTGPTLAAGGDPAGNGLAPIFNFNGGTMRASQSDSTHPNDIAEGWHRFMRNLWHAYVQAGGAIIDTQDFTNSIDQALEHDPALGATRDGGLTKRGSGTLTLLQQATYTGDTMVSAGVLEVQHAYLDDASSVSVAAGASMFLNFEGTDAIAGLTLDGLALNPGIYNAVSHPAFFSGQGSLQVEGSVGGDPPVLSISPQGNELLLTWTSSPDLSYDVLGSPDMLDGLPSWQIYDGNNEIPHNADKDTPEDDGDDRTTTVKVLLPPDESYYFIVAGYDTP